MLVLFESSAGYALFKVKDESKLSKVDNVFAEFETPEKAGKLCVAAPRARYQSTHALHAGVARLTESFPSLPAACRWLVSTSSRTPRM